VNVVIKDGLSSRRHLICLLLFLFCLVGVSHAQQVDDNINEANTYLDVRTSKLDKYLNQSQNIQQRLLKKLKRKEDKVLRKLAAKDSAAYKQYMMEHPISYDSIARIAIDTSLHPKIFGNNKTIDSLKGVQRFIQSETGKIGNSAAALNQTGIAIPGTSNLTAIQQKMNTQLNTSQLIQQHTADLEKMVGVNNISGLQGIQKQVFYARAKIKSYKQMADDPDATEAKALEYLQSTDGFGKFLNQNNSAFGGIGNNATAADLQSAGFQTKTQINDIMQAKLGSNVGSVQDQMSQQVQTYSDKLNDITSKVNQAKADLNEAKADINTAKSTLNDAKSGVSNIDKPSFKTNAERGKPFLKRLEFQYNFQTLRASVDGLRPAMLILSATVAFKQTEKLSYGIGFGLNNGLGQNWQHIRFSYEGFSTRVYIDRKWLYGFSLQLGYERDFIPVNRPYLSNTADQVTTSTPVNPSIQQTDNSLFKTAFGGTQQSAYLGIMKRYKISSKWNGTLLVGYNFLWQDEGGKSPWLLRLGWGVRE
jgi:outer membrane murein-binding lipoprotein Lpp